MSCARSHEAMSGAGAFSANMSSVPTGRYWGHAWWEIRARHGKAAQSTVAPRTLGALASERSTSC
jgi:hypothetical protein